MAISDGGDNASKTNFTDTLRKAHASNAVIYAIALVDPLVPDQNPKLLRRFADATGGRFFDPRSVERVDEALREISLDIRSGYTLAYVPSNSLRDDTVRRIQVDVVGLDNRRLVGKTRAGYVAAAEHHPEVEVGR